MDNAGAACSTVYSAPALSTAAHATLATTLTHPFSPATPALQDVQAASSSLPRHALPAATTTSSLAALAMR